MVCQHIECTFIFHPRARRLLGVLITLLANKENQPAHPALRVSADFQKARLMYMAGFLALMKQEVVCHESIHC